MPLTAMATRTSDPMDIPQETMLTAAENLVRLYDRPFGGKERGRYRISVKHLNAILGRRRLYDEDIVHLQRAVYELGYVLIDLESYYIVLSQRTFTSYRRVNEASLKEGDGSL